MTFYDTQLQQLQEKLARKGQLKAQAAELRTQCRTLKAAETLNFSKAAKELYITPPILRQADHPFGAVHGFPPL